MCSPAWTCNKHFCAQNLLTATCMHRVWALELIPSFALYRGLYEYVHNPRPAMHEHAPCHAQDFASHYLPCLQVCAVRILAWLRGKPESSADA